MLPLWPGVANWSVETEENWRAGDLFAGVGRADVDRGEYRVFGPDGGTKDTLDDPFAIKKTTTTGCFVAAPGTAAEAMYATGFASLHVTRFDAAAPHEARTVASINYPDVAAVESIAFDTAGNYYLGTLPAPRKSALDPIPPYAYILKYSAANVMLAAYQVPTGMRGANWIDPGLDQQTI